MGCGCKKGSPQTSNVREATDLLFNRGDVAGAGRHRQMQCAHANECHFFCEWLGKEPGEIPFCGHPEAKLPGRLQLYAAYKRRDWKCPLGLF